MLSSKKLDYLILHKNITNKQDHTPRDNIFRISVYKFNKKQIQLLKYRILFLYHERLNII